MIVILSGTALALLHGLLFLVVTDVCPPKENAVSSYLPCVAKKEVV